MSRLCTKTRELGKQEWTTQQKPDTSSEKYRKNQVKKLKHSP